ncbi:MAG TPA: cupin domain-containing protein [Jatrophihabitans sp.]|nr:cupin domain-containing protein [Jatrophihabitans sp.]
MGTPVITTEEPRPIAERVAEFLPAQGSFEYQNDQPGKTHNWHKHSLDETLFVLDGGMEIFWNDEDGVHRAQAGPGTRIALPANTVHGSTAGQSGCTYIIAPEGGRTAVTEFLSAEEFPSG